MNFGSLSSAHQIMIRLALIGGPEYDASVDAAAASTGRLGKMVLETATAMDTATKRSWLHNQAMFTARRYAFYATLAVSGLAYEVFKLGMSYDSARQQAEVALRRIFPTQNAMDSVISRLYKMSTLSPFLFKDTLTAFRTLYPAFHAVGIGTGLTLRTLQGAMNGLAESGRATPGSLTRIGVQLQHLANIGRPTGQVLLALARDGLPVYPALRHELGLTGTALENLSTSGLTAKQVLQALAKYETTVAPFAGAAKRLAESTLQGNWQMFKDMLAQAAGGAGGGLFAGLQTRLKAVNDYLAPLFTANRPITLYSVAAAIDHALTPKTHILLNLFITFTAALAEVVKLFTALFSAISTVLWPVDKLAGLFGASSVTAKLFGSILGELVFWFIIAKAVLMPFMIAIDLWKSAVAAAKAVSVAFAVIQAIMNREWMVAYGLLTRSTVATSENAVANEADTLTLREQYDAMIAKNAIMGASIPVVEEATTANLGFAASLDAMLGPIGLVIAGLTLIIMFHKQIARWTGMSTWNPLSHNFWHSSGTRNTRVTPAQHAAATAPRGHSWFDNLNPTHWFATGGRMAGGGTAMVGEYGPELVNLPGGSTVTPLSRATLAGAGSLAIHVYPQDIYLDGRKFATVMAEVVTDKQARK